MRLLAPERWGRQQAQLETAAQTAVSGLKVTYMCATERSATHAREMLTLWLESQPTGFREAVEAERLVFRYLGQETRAQDRPALLHEDPLGAPPRPQGST